MAGVETKLGELSNKLEEQGQKVGKLQQLVAVLVVSHVLLLLFMLLFR